MASFCTNSTRNKAKSSGICTNTGYSDGRPSLLAGRPSQQTETGAGGGEIEEGVEFRKVTYKCNGSLGTEAQDLLLFRLVKSSSCFLGFTIN